MIEHKFDKFGKKCGLLPNNATSLRVITIRTSHTLTKCKTILGMLMMELFVHKCREIQRHFQYLDTIFKIIRGNMGYYIGL